MTDRAIAGLSVARPRPRSRLLDVLGATEIRMALLIVLSAFSVAFYMSLQGTGADRPVIAQAVRQSAAPLAAQTAIAKSRAPSRTHAHARSKAHRLKGKANLEALGGAKTFSLASRAARPELASAHGRLAASVLMARVEQGAYTFTPPAALPDEVLDALPRALPDPAIDLPAIAGGSERIPSASLQVSTV